MLVTDWAGHSWNVDWHTNIEATNAIVLRLLILFLLQPDWWCFACNVLHRLCFAFVSLTVKEVDVQSVNRGRAMQCNAMPIVDVQSVNANRILLKKNSLIARVPSQTLIFNQQTVVHIETPQNIPKPAGELFILFWYELLTAIKRTCLNSCPAK